MKVHRQIHEDKDASKALTSHSAVAIEELDILSLSTAIPSKLSRQDSGQSKRFLLLLEKLERSNNKAEGKDL